MSDLTLEIIFESMFHGKYDFDDFLSCDIKSCYEKIKSKNRDVYRINKKLKEFHIFLNLFLFDFLPVMEGSVFSYRKGVNVLDAVKIHADSKFFFKTDISDFFNSIDKDEIIKVITKNKSLIPFCDVDVYIDRIIDLVTIDGVIPLGFSTSPAISNAVLYSFDALFSEHSSNNELIYSRYSDDIIVSSKDNKCISGVDVFISKILEENFDGKFKLNKKKSIYTHKGNKVKILGMVITPNGYISVDSKIKEDIEISIYFYIKNKSKFIERINGNISDGVNKISGYLNYINTIDPNYINKLRKKYGATVIDMFIKNSVK